MLNPGPNQIRWRMFWKQTVYHVHKQNNLKIIIIKRSHVLPSGHRKGDAITSQQEIYFVWRIHFFAASFWIFFTSCLMILFLCRQTDTHTQYQSLSSQYCGSISNTQLHFNVKNELLSFYFLH